MVEHEDPVENELKERLNNGKPGPDCSAAGQGTCSSSNSDADMQNVENGLRQGEEATSIRGRRRFTLRCSTFDRVASLLKKPVCHYIIILVLALALIISVSFNIRQHEKLQLKELQSTTALPPSTACPPNWIKNGTTCYLFVNTDGTWDSSQSNCASYSASLATIHSQEEWAFLKKHGRRTEYWLNLRRKNVDEHWVWPNGSLVASWLPVGGKGLCGYLNEKAASSTTCDNDRYWICSKPASST